jgi:hypothetical protein
MAFNRTSGSGGSSPASSSRSLSRATSLDSIPEDRSVSPASLTPRGPSAPSSFAARGLAPLNLGGSAAGTGAFSWANLSNLPRASNATPVLYEHGSLRRNVGRTVELGHGLEARVYGEPRTALKVFGNSAFNVESRDHEFAALTRLHRHTPGLVPQPLSTGRVTMQSGSTAESLEMERIPGGQSLRNRRSTTPELRALRPLLGTFHQALRATGTSWDDTPSNIMRTADGSHRFIDVKLNTQGTPLPAPHVFAHGVLRSLAANPASAARAMTTTLELPPTSTAPAHLFPALTPTFKPKKAKPKSGSSSAATTLPPISRR